MNRLLAAVLLTATTTTGCDEALPPRFGGPLYAGTLQKVSGDEQEVKRGMPVPVPPSVRVLDQWGEPLAGYAVTFEVESGGGSITGGSQVTGADGVATVGSWRVGTTIGPNTLRVTAGDIEAVFTASAADPCDVLVPVALNTPVADSLIALDCHSGDLPYWDYYRLNGVQAPAILVTLRSSAFQPHLELFSIDRAVSEAEINAPAGDSVATIRLLVQGGDYIIAVSSRAGEGQPTGEYRLATSATSAAVNACADVFVAYARPVTDLIEDTDCSDPDGYFDRIRFVGNAQPVTITMSSTQYAPILVVRNQAGIVVTADTGTTSAAASVTFTPAIGVHTIEARAAAGATGGYVLELQ